MLVKKKASDYTCDYVEMQDNFPKIDKELDYGREICCVLKFYNTSRDSIFLPFFSIGILQYKSHFYIKYKNKATICPASFWGTQVSSFVVAPGEHVRIGIIIYPEDLDELEIKRDIDIKDLSNMISIFYQYVPSDSTFNHLKTPIIEIKQERFLKLTYGANFSTSI